MRGRVRPAPWAWPLRARRLAAWLLAVLWALPALSEAAAPGDKYPQRPIRLIVGFTPGGATDLVARLVADKLAERFGQQVVVDNRPGASGIIGARLVGSSLPDGYTLLISGSSISIVGTLLKEARFDVQRDLQPLAMVATSAYVLVAHPSIGVKTVPDLIAYAKPRAGKLSYGASTPGTVQHLSTEMLICFGSGSALEILEYLRLQSRH